jgi:hypothetical protein
MIGYPLDPAERAALREQYLERETLNGVRHGLHHGQSMRCRNGDHGCRNDGSGCMCPCHDSPSGRPKEAP